MSDSESRKAKSGEPEHPNRLTQKPSEKSPSTVTLPEKANVPVIMVVDIMVPSHSVIRSHKAADFFVIFGYCDSPATWCWKGESLH